MSVRSFDLRDLPLIYQYRNEAISLDTLRLLTRGNPLGALSLVAYIDPRRHVYSAVATDEGTTLLGSITQINGEASARLLYVAPASCLNHPALPTLIEHLIAEAGTWGALHVLAEVEETSEAFPSLRRAGFSVYAWQRLWEVSSLARASESSAWTRARAFHLPALQSLYHQIVPPLLQAIEPPPKRAAGFICCGEPLRGYVNMASGQMGIVLTPLIHPEIAAVGQKLTALVGALPHRDERPIYLCVRSYQAWLEPVLEDLGALSGPRQAVMVKHVARPVREEQTARVVKPSTARAQPSHFSRPSYKGGKHEALDPLQPEPAHTAAGDDRQKIVL